MEMGLAAGYKKAKIPRKPTAYTDWIKSEWANTLALVEEKNLKKPLFKEFLKVKGPEWTARS